MGFLQNMLGRRQDAEQSQNEACEAFRTEIAGAMGELMALFSDRTHFIDPDQQQIWEKAHAQLLSDACVDRILRLRKAEHSHLLAAEYQELTQCAAILREEILRHNDELAQRDADRVEQLIGAVEGHTLDRQQLCCIAKDVRSHLVLAGAGTGKTTTIIGKIKYLLAAGLCRPEEILVLSFTNASAGEMTQRIRKETGAPVSASTFHSLGLSILRQVDGASPSVTSVNLRSFLRQQLEQQLKKREYLAVLTAYLLYYRIPSMSEFSFRSQREYDSFRLRYPPKTSKNQTVKTYAEMDIANFLTQNGIPYRYEYAYAFDPHTPEYGTYRPCFYLQTHKIYIEYWSISRNGKVPPYFPGKNGQTASALYAADMQWKRDLHQANHTALVECYAYEKAEGTMLINLKQHLEALGVKCKPVTPKKLWETLSQTAGTVDGMVSLMETVITLMKSNEDTPASVRERNRGTPMEAVNEMLLQLVEPMYAAYCSALEKAGEVDFNDMINRASRYLAEGRWCHGYRYVIVDEYQDISRARFRLLEQMRRVRDYHLFCVGDDWQSIYRFAGSDIGFILNFEQYWGKSELSRIETTYRFPQQLIDITGSFMMENPAQQKKQMAGRTDEPGFALGEICGQTEAAAVEQMRMRLCGLPKNSSVYLIGRYCFDLRILQEHPKLQCTQNTSSGFTELTDSDRPDLKLTFLTAHRSKGLQADYVVILNNRNSRLGFPSRIQDAPLLQLLLHSWETYPDAEERRLFYVALTRARKKAFLLTVKGEESDFVLELRQKYGPELRQEALSAEAT